MATTNIVPGFPLEEPAGDTAPLVPSFGIISGLKGDFGAESTRIPFLGIGQKTSDITENHPEAMGQLIYGGKHIIPKPVVISFFGAEQRYRQNTTFDRNMRPKTFLTKQQVLAAGGNLERFVRAGVDDNNYVPELLATVVLFVETHKSEKKKNWAQNPEVMSHPLHLAEGTQILAVPVFWPLRGVAYGQIVPNLRMIDRALRESGKELAHARFDLNVTKQVFNSNSTFVPILNRLEEDNSAETVETLHKIFGA